MIIIFTPEKETKKIPYYCVSRTQKDGVRRITHFGIKQRKKMLDFLNRYLLDDLIDSILVEKCEKDETFNV